LTLSSQDNGIGTIMHKKKKVNAETTQAERETGTTISGECV